MNWKRIVAITLMIILIMFMTTTAKTFNAPQEIKQVTVAKVAEVEPTPTLYNINMITELQTHIWGKCEEFGIPYELELAILYTESGFNQDARNYNDTCRGMGQMSRETGERVANALKIENFWQENVFDAEYNADCSIYHLWELKQIGIERGYSDEDNCLFILGAYNRGIAGYDNYVREHNRMETSYSDKVLNYKSQLEQYGEFK